MRRIILFILLGVAVATGLRAQSITPGSHWFDGRLIYEASDVSGDILLKSIISREPTSYMLSPDPEMEGWFTTPDKEDDGWQESMCCLTEDAGRTMLVFYKEGRVTALFEQTDKSLEEAILERWFPTVRGKFLCTTPAGRTYHFVIGDNTLEIDGVATTYHMVTSNGYPLDVLVVPDGVAEGAWHFIRTIDGFNTYRTRLNETGEYEQLYEDVDDRPNKLTWDDPTKSRWSFLSDTFIIPISYTKETLLLIRNTILAQHGYVFTDKALKKYFKARPWYKPARDNSSIQLNFIEQMNVARIQGEEAKPDALRKRVTEEAPGIHGALK